MTATKRGTARWLRWIVIAGALLLALFAALDFRSRRRVQNRLERLMAQGGASARSPEAAADVAREPDAARAELRAARLLLADELDQTWRAALSPTARREDRAKSAERLAAIRDIAARNLESKSSSWQAAMILGATRYLEAVRSARPSGAHERAAWTAPLELAERLGPGKPEPTRFLAAAALSDWPRLNQTERRQAVGTLRRGFEDPETLDLLLEAWMRLAPSETVALEALPDRVQTWLLLEAFYARSQDWERFASIRRRRTATLERELEERLREAEERLEGRDTAGGRALLLNVLADTPPDMRYTRVLERVMKLLPAGSIGEWRRRRLGAWLDWTRERCLLEECPLSPPTIRRIAGAVGLHELHQQATAAMMAGDVGRAQTLAQRSSTTLLPEWGPYLLLASRHHARTGDIAQARAALQKVHRSWHPTAGYRAVIGRLADSDPALAANRRPAAQWSAADWRREASGHRLELETDEACGGLRVEVSSSADGSAVEARWNGESIDWFSVESRTRRRLERSIEPGYNVLELVTIGGGRLVPGRVDLLACPA